MTDKKDRTRWTALAEELTEPIKPITKPVIDLRAAPKSNVPRIFDQTLEVSPLGIPDPCPACGCRAFMPVYYAAERQWRVTCLACPATPTYVTATEPAKSTYHCLTCRVTVFITLDEDQINVFCLGQCKGIKLHERKGAGRWKPNKEQSRPFAKKLTNVKPGQLPWFDESMKVSKETIQTIMDFQREVEQRPTDRSYFYEASTPSTDTSMSQAEVLGAVDLLDNVQRTDVLYDRLGLKKYDIFYREQYQKNSINGFRDPRRRTGRTTRMLLEAISMVFAYQAIRLFIRTSSDAHRKELVERAWNYYYAFDGKITKPLYVVGKFAEKSGSVFEKAKMQSFFYEKSRDAVFLTDHHWYEVNS
jgi:hypothetical protein